MSAPVLARSTEDGRRFYPWKSESFWSVTELIGGGIPKYLGPHYAKMAAELAYESILSNGPHSRATAIVNRLGRAGYADVAQRQARGELRSIKLEKLTKRELALRWLKGAAERHRMAAAAIGLAVHDEAEQLVLRLALADSELVLEGGGTAAQLTPWPNGLEGYETSFRAWLKDWAPIFLAAEATVFNRPQAYAGTLDAIVRIRAGRLRTAITRRGQKVPDWLAGIPSSTLLTVIVDYKAGRVVYPEVSVQLSAYARAEFIGGADGETEIPLPAIDVGAVLHLTPKGYRFRLVRIDDVPFNTFLFAREVYRFRHEHAATVLLEDLSPVGEAAA